MEKYKKILIKKTARNPSIIAQTVGIQTVILPCGSFHFRQSYDPRKMVLYPSVFVNLLFLREIW